MRKKEELKTEVKTVKMTKTLLLDIEREASERGIKVATVMNERLAHSENTLTPPLMARIQDLTNHVSSVVQEYAPKESKKIQKEVNEIWMFLNKNV